MALMDVFTHFSIIRRERRGIRPEEIKIDGDSHNREDAQTYDLERTQILSGYGLTVIRFTNQEVLSNFEGVCGVIGSLIPPTPLDKGGFDPSLLRGI
ncbi:hypothetical protein myaer87_32870 [Microcystis aeruginosa NIES-87]|nr:hypothetical protein myaer87_32870 [Microcystis aeruginosa NIES-87]